MQVSSNIIDQHHGMPLQAVFGKSEKTIQTEENNRFSNRYNSNFLNSSQKNNYKTFENSVFQKNIQNEYLNTQKADSYLGKLQKVLEKFKEYNKKIARDALNDNTISQSTRDDYAKGIEKIIQDFPMLKETSIEAGNLQIRTLLGINFDSNIFDFGNNILNQKNEINHELINNKVSNVLSDVKGKRVELQNTLDNIEKFVSVSQHIDNKIFDFAQEIPSKVHKNLTPDKAIELLA